MFTGLVETTAKLIGRGGDKLTLLPAKRFADLEYGESIAVNGCCLTLERENTDGSLIFHTLAETLQRTNLEHLPLGARVNLERALCLGDRLGGHIVAGHIDGTGRVRALRKAGEDTIMDVEFPAELAVYFVCKGSVALDGVSLTLAALERDFFSVHLIPVTRADTALPDRRVGDSVNLETDLMGKYVLRSLELAEAPKKESGVTLEKLREAGFAL